MIIAVTIDRGPRKKLRSFNQISGSAGGITFPGPNSTDLTTPLDGDVLYWFALQRTAIDLIKKRQEQSRVNTMLRQCLRQSAGNVGQSAGLGKGHSFR